MRLQAAVLSLVCACAQRVMYISADASPGEDRPTDVLPVGDTQLPAANDVNQPVSSCGVGGFRCNVVSGEGCQVGETCVLYLSISGYATRCRVGTRALGETCDAADLMPMTCAPGLVCSAGLCRKPCCRGDDSSCRDTPQLGSGSRCSVNTYLQRLPDFFLCSEPCDWRTQDCPNDYLCYPDQGGNTLCLPPGPGRAGDPCSTANDCGPHMACSQTSTVGMAGQCRPVCTESIACPPPYRRCARVSDSVFGFGVCSLN
jgi:hypothetical protein